MIGESWHSRIDGNINRILSVVTEDKKKDELINKQSEAIKIMRESGVKFYSNEKCPMCGCLKPVEKKCWICTNSK